MSSAVPDSEEIGKLFVGGLSSKTTKESLHGYFSLYGEITDCVVMKNNETGRSRGFGFVTYKDPLNVYKVLQAALHELDGKKIDPKECTPRSLQKSKKQTGKCKLFLGGLPPDVSEEDVHRVMSVFGKVDQVIVMRDQETKKCRGFGFLSYELEESIEQACAVRFVTIKDKQVECKKAEPKTKTSNVSDQFKYPNYSVPMPPYGMIGNVDSNSWTLTPGQAQYSMSAGFPGYQNFSSPPAPPVCSSPISGYTGFQQLPYTQAYSPSYGQALANFSFSSVSPNSFSQASLQVSPANSAGSPPNNEAGNVVGGTDGYSQNALSFKPVKAAFCGLSDTIYTQNVTPSVKRYHPYKV